MTDASKYVKIVEWSDEDGMFVGQCPGVIGPCCRELCQIVEEWVELMQKEGRPLPPPTAGRNLANLIGGK